jgi:type II restriction/modification system DNA methylase subunit YeeA
MRAAIAKLTRYIVTPRVAKHRLFVWLERNVIPDGRLNVFTREDDYFFGVLHSHIHEIWSLAHAAKHGVGNDPTYNNRACFETFPFPWPPRQEPVDDPRVQAIAQAAQELVAKRAAWLNPPGLEGKELQKRTLTNLYNQRPTWLELAHKKLDAAVFAAYGWPADLTDEEILARLLALNLQRAGVV